LFYFAPFARLPAGRPACRRAGGFSFRAITDFGVQFKNFSEPCFLVKLKCCYGKQIDVKQDFD